MATPPMLDQRRGALSRRRPDPVAAISVALFTACLLGLSVGGVLAIYDWRTPGAEKPLFYVVLGLFTAGILVLVLGATVRWARSRPT